MEYVKVIKMVNFDEEIGDWESHSGATRRILNFFATTGHYHYAKCGRMYLPQMLELPSNYPSIYKSLKRMDTIAYGDVTDTGPDFAPIW